MLDRVGHEAQRQKTEVLQRPRHWQLPDVQWTQSEAFDEGGAALAISCAPELFPGVTKRVRSGATGLVMSTRSLPASADALAGSRVITSTVCPALTASVAIAVAMPPEPMMLIVLTWGLLDSRLAPVSPKCYGAPYNLDH
ncbi:hypothetical protein BJI69_17740 [Luteibacter rhizovicinus DSM 16549]|uniref:Uncharacterized protein n=1 Tax=Luteibacter rhizovicinus DSM 16549 TaxID=1440763 RepID=A0A0G9HC25_9GAMM|nr:hypothetical protein BJI69_17740 [Luteibacter rhizovicinus DSM 16549]KLD67046.1 hypothetical protein Y883_10835 [Luteibacter rhizovicinus DSM 16549]KLD75069.1 hypothetical protein Y886_29185 [Xanthomonas hyacinthi DSM 19077]